MSHQQTVQRAAAPELPTRTQSRSTPIRLSNRGRLAALFCFGLWMVIFAGGILIDTQPYRMIISPGGVAALSGAEVAPGTPATTLLGERSFQDLAVSWIVVMIWFLPLNLALLCAVSAVLGAFGSVANLETDQIDATGRDRTNPYVSALLRGFFVYLIMISGILLLDHEPFSNPGPEQYIRLAGLLSMFAFMVNYNPQVFNRLLSFAADRVEARNGLKSRPAHVEETVQIERETQVTSVRSSLELSSNAPGPAAVVADQSDVQVAGMIKPTLHSAGNSGAAAEVPPVRIPGL